MIIVRNFTKPTEGKFDIVKISFFHAQYPFPCQDSLFCILVNLFNSIKWILLLLIFIPSYHEIPIGFFLLISKPTVFLYSMVIHLS